MFCQEICAQNRSRLVEIETEQEHDFIVNNIYEPNSPNGKSYQFGIKLIRMIKFFCQESCIFYFLFFISLIMHLYNNSCDTWQLMKVQDRYPSAKLFIYSFYRQISLKLFPLCMSQQFCLLLYLGCQSSYRLDLFKWN